MKFVKGMMIGLAVGAMYAATHEDMMECMMRKGKRCVRRMEKMYGF